MRRLAVSKCDHASASRTRSTVASFSTAGWSEVDPARAGPPYLPPERWGPGQPTSVAVAAACPHHSLIVGALGYLGGVLIVVAASLSANGNWADIPIWGRAALPLSPGWALLPADLQPSRPSG